MNLEKLHYFVDLVDTSSFTKTGLKNHVSQTSVSQQIRSLEDHFNVKLIDRTVTPIAPTEAGKILYEESLRVLRQYDVLEEKLTDFKEGQKRIRIEYTSATELDFLVELTEKLKKQTELEFDLEKVQLKDVSAGLKNGQYDLAISFDSEFWDEKLLQTFPLYQGTYAALVGRNHPSFNQEAISSAELYQYPLVMLSPEAIGKSYHMMLSNALQDGFQPDIQKTVDDIETEFFLLRTQPLIGLFPDNYSLPVAQDKLKLVPIKDTNHKFEIVFAYRKDFDESLLSQVVQAIHSLDYKKKL
ncbi:LysR family transcriptional regulator [Fructobacillus tropaeoli]|uniref:LysR family transcriptional regulator n=1 Tax=Fructobacillus tropaeoli TaxID=709323 RepID=UPI002D9F863B|nr:DNA-binding transcriptional regulator [Fructobacillus tropaeoli]